MNRETLATVEDVFKVAKTDERVQAIINKHLLRLGFSQHLVVGYSFEKQIQFSPAFCLGVQIVNFPIGFIFVSEGLSEILDDEELEFVVLHEMCHIVKNHFISTAFVWLMKSYIVDLIADGFEVSKKKATEYLGWIKTLYVLVNQKQTIEEEAKARVELEADQYAVIYQSRKEPAISTLTKLSNGMISAPTHVTIDGRYSFPVITFEKRIEAIRNCSLSCY